MKLFSSKNIKVLLGIFALVVLIFLLQKSGFFSNIEGNTPLPPKKNKGEAVFSAGECKSGEVDVKFTRGGKQLPLTCK